MVSYTDLPHSNFTSAYVGVKSLGNMYDSIIVISKTVLKF